MVEGLDRILGSRNRESSPPAQNCEQIPTGYKQKGTGSWAKVKKGIPQGLKRLLFCWLERPKAEALGLSDATAKTKTKADPYGMTTKKAKDNCRFWIDHRPSCAPP
jgi:hypothetical protein